MAADRDFETNPYSPDEARVASFLSDLGAGGGDDPIGFILASHRLMADERKAQKALLQRIAASHPQGTAANMALAYLRGED